MSSMRSSLLAVLVLSLTGGCSPDEEFQCLEDSACSNDGIEGVCQPTGYCSFPDPDCESGYRYGDLADAFAQQCVPVDGGSSGMVDPATSSGSSTGGAACGDGIVDPGELCDGDALNGATCISQGFDGGDLVCTAECTFDEAQCHLCGDGVIGGAEACDAGELGGLACVDVEGFDGGELACQANCQLDTSACTACGNGTREDGEACDGSDVGSATCASRGFAEGMIGCNDDCTLDTSPCIPVGCGNGLLERDEACDTDTPLPTCDERGLGIGVTACADDCTIDTSGCGEPSLVSVVAEGAVSVGATLTLACADGTASCMVPPGVGQVATVEDLNAGCSIQCAQGSSVLATAAPAPMSLNVPTGYRIQTGVMIPMNATDCMEPDPCEVTFSAVANERTVRFVFEAGG